MSKKKGFDDAIGGDLLGKVSATKKIVREEKLQEDRARKAVIMKETEATDQASNIKKLEEAIEMMKMELGESPVTKVGRPAKNHGRKRTSVIVAPELWNEFKILSMKHGSSVSDFLETAISDALEKYKK